MKKYNKIEEIDYSNNITWILEVDFFTDSLNPIISSFCNTLLFNIIIHIPGEKNMVKDT